MKHILSIDDLSRKEIEFILKETASEAVMRNYAKPETTSLIERIKVRPKATLLFTEASTRTCYSYEEAARRCGFDVTVLTDKEMLSLKKGESLADTARMLAGQGADVLVIRTPFEGGARFAAEILDQSGYHVSVQNGGDGANRHPTQALLDLFTILRLLGRLDNFTFGAVGDLRYSRVLHSVLPALAKFKGIKVRLVSCPETKLQDQYKIGFREVIESDSLEALADCDVVEVTRIQEERFTDPAELEKVRGKFVIDQDILDRILKPNVFIMHPLPRREEIHPEISDDPRVKMFVQADLGIPLRMALVMLGFKGRFEKNETPKTTPAEWEKIASEPIDNHLQRRQKEGRYFRPIRDGVVIDHLPHHIAIILRNMLNGILKRNGGAVIHLIEGVPSKRYGKKDVLVLEYEHLDDNARSAIAFLAPDVTFNHVSEGIFRKTIIQKLPSILFGFLRCPNPVCITNHEPEAKTRFMPRGNDTVECYFCNREFSREEMLRALKK